MALVGLSTASRCGLAAGAAVDETRRVAVRRFRSFWAGAGSIHLHGARWAPNGNEPRCEAAGQRSYATELAQVSILGRAQPRTVHPAGGWSSPPTCPSAEGRCRDTAASDAVPASPTPKEGGDGHRPSSASRVRRRAGDEGWRPTLRVRDRNFTHRGWVGPGRCCVKPSRNRPRCRRDSRATR